MAKKSDGSVIIDTKMNTNGIVKGVADTAKKISSLGNSLNGLGEKIKRTFSADLVENGARGYSEIQKEIKQTEKQLDRLIEKQIRFVETGGNIKSRAFEGMEYDIELARNKLEGLRTELSTISKTTPKQMDKVRKAVDRVVKSFGLLDKNVKKSHRGLLTMLGTSILFSTVFRGLNLITQGFTEGLNNLVQYSDDANSSMSDLKSSLTQLKNGFATAFMPIITTATPALTQLMSVISKATSYVSAFVSALSGKDTYIKAVEVQEDYAASLDKTADSAKKAQKYLSGLDEIRTFTEPETSVEVSPKDMFTEEVINSPILTFADKVRNVINEIKALIGDEDWEGLGMYISNGIARALNFLSEKLKNYNWEGLGHDIGEFLEGIEWKDVITNALKLKFDIWATLAQLWFGAFEAAPFETTILSAFALLKFTPLGGMLASKIATSLTSSTAIAKVASAGAKLMGALGASIAAAIGGFAIGQWLYEVITDEEIDMTWAEQFDIIKESFSDGTWKEALKLWGNDIRSAFTMMGEEIVNWWDDTVVDWYEDEVQPFFSKDNWMAAINGVKEAFAFTWKAAVNGAIELLNKFIDYLNDKMHFEWDGLNILGKQIIPSGSMQLFTVPKIPMLATGAVIPPNAPFMAMLGDQKHGTNIEAPLDTIKQAVREVIGTGGNGQMIRNILYLNNRVVYDAVMNVAQSIQDTTGKNPFDLA